MLFTENEARNKWCPFALAVRGDGVSGFNRDANMGPDVATYCLASGCMMWRKVDQVGIGPNGERRDRDMDGRTRWVDRGFCGLAGKVLP